MMIFTIFSVDLNSGIDDMPEIPANFRLKPEDFENTLPLCCIQCWHCFEDHDFFFKEKLEHDKVKQLKIISDDFLSDDQFIHTGCTWSSDNSKRHLFFLEQYRNEKLIFQFSGKRLYGTFEGKAVGILKDGKGTPCIRKIDGAFGSFSLAGVDNSCAFKYEIILLDGKVAIKISNVEKLGVWVTTHEMYYENGKVVKISSNGILEQVKYYNLEGHVIFDFVPKDSEEEKERKVKEAFENACINWLAPWREADMTLLVGDQLLDI